MPPSTTDFPYLERLIQMTPIEITFWLSVAILFYCYLGYGILLVAFNAVKRLCYPSRKSSDFELLPVTLIVAAYNAECLKAIVRHYSDPGVGGVAGEKRIIRNSCNSVLGKAEGMYWKYESFMKQQDSSFNTVVGASGELFSIRTELFELHENNLILDDFIISMQVCLEGYKIKYEPHAYAIEYP